MTLKSLAAAAVFALAVPIVAWAGCKSDYQDAVQSCQLMYEDPDEADDLALCVQQAKDEYEECIE